MEIMDSMMKMELLKSCESRNVLKRRIFAGRDASLLLLAYRANFST